MITQWISREMLVASPSAEQVRLESIGGERVVSVTSQSKAFACGVESGLWEVTGNKRFRKLKHILKIEKGLTSKLVTGLT